MFCVLNHGRSKCSCCGRPRSAVSRGAGHPHGLPARLLGHEGSLAKANHGPGAHLGRAPTFAVLTCAPADYRDACTVCSMAREKMQSWTRLCSVHIHLRSVTSFLCLRVCSTAAATPDRVHMAAAARPVRLDRRLGTAGTCRARSALGRPLRLRCSAVAAPEQTVRPI